MKNLLLDLFVNLCVIVWQIFYLLFGIVFVKLLCVALSALFGWILGLFAGDFILSIFAQLGITGFSMLQIGAFLGFIGSFFYSPINIRDLRSLSGFSSANKQQQHPYHM